MGCAKMLRIIDALTGVFASSAEAPGAHAPSVRRVPARSVAPPRTRAIRVEIPTCDASSVVDDEGMEREALQLLAAVEEGELDQERHAVDDLLATGGTMAATLRLIEQLGGHIVGVAFLIELAFLHGRGKLKNYPFHSLIVYD